ncbi:MAG: hypothetical protein AAF441_19150 [Pseudomonadota bacterium]
MTRMIVVCLMLLMPFAGTALADACTDKLKQGDVVTGSATITKIQRDQNYGEWAYQTKNLKLDNCPKSGELAYDIDAVVNMNKEQTCKVGDRLEFRGVWGCLGIGCAIMVGFAFKCG